MNKNSSILLSSKSYRYNNDTTTKDSRVDVNHINTIKRPSSPTDDLVLLDPSIVVKIKLKRKLSSRSEEIGNRINNNEDTIVQWH